MFEACSFLGNGREKGRKESGVALITDWLELSFASIRYIPLYFSSLNASNASVFTLLVLPGMTSLRLVMCEVVLSSQASRSQQ